MRGCSNSTGQVRRCQLPKGERAWGPQAPGTRHSTPPLGFACLGCLPKLVLAFLDAMYPPLSFLRPPRPPRFESALRMESPTHKIDHPSSSLSVIMLTQSLPSFPSPRQQELQQESSRRRHGRYQLRYHRIPSASLCFLLLFVSRPAALLLAESEPLPSPSQLLLTLLLRSFLI